MSNQNIMKHTTKQRFELYYNSIIAQDLLLKNNYKNISELPKFDKIVINTTSKFYVTDRKNLIPILLALELITGQKAKFTCAKKSIAPFKIRENQILGCKITLRRKRLYNFLNILVSIVLPRFRDFSGITKKSFDNSNNISIGFTNLFLFPQIENYFEYFENIRGINITFCTKSGKKTFNQLVYTAYQLPITK